MNDVPLIRRGSPADLTAIESLLQNAGLPTEDIRDIPGLRTWVIETGYHFAVQLPSNRSLTKAFCGHLRSHLTPAVRASAAGWLHNSRVMRVATDSESWCS